MEDDKRNIDAARRLARRNARATGTAYQTCLNDLARSLGRDHWKAFMESPTVVPRDASPDASASGDVGGILNGFGRNPPDDVVARLFRDAWCMKREDRPSGLESLPFVPAHDVLALPHLPPKGIGRDAHVVMIADVLCPRVDARGRRDYFAQKANGLIVGFVHLEIGRAEQAGRAASMYAMIDDLHVMHDVASRRRGLVRDSLGHVLGDMASESAHRGFHPVASDVFRVVASMPHNERSGVLGTADHALLPLRDPLIRSLIA